MNWVNEKEEWLVDWGDARCLKEISVEGAAGVAPLLQAEGDEQLDVFFSDAVEACGRCLVCRAGGPVVDVFDISPGAEALVCWRLRLPSPVVPDIGIAYAQDAGGTSLSLMFLTKARIIHTLRVVLDRGSPELVVEGSIACSLSSTPCSFCVLDRGFAAVGCFDGALHAVRAGQAHAAYEFADLSLSQRLMSGLVRPSPPLVLALASLGRSEGALLTSGFLLLSFSADGKLRLWEALQHRGLLLASRPVLPSGQDHSLSSLGTSSVYMRVSGSRTRACLVLRSTVLVIDLSASGVAGGFTVREIEPPFASAAPSLVALSHGTLWSFWSGQSREQLFHLNLEEQDARTWQSKALDSGLLGPDLAGEALRRTAVEGCVGGAAPGAASHRSVFTLYQQQEVWRGEEDGFDACQVAEMFEAMKQRGPGQEAPPGATTEFIEPFDKDMSVEDAVLNWWVGRVFMPGRFSESMIAAALGSVGVLLAQGPGAPSSSVLRSAVEDHLRAQAAALCGRGEDFAMTSHLQVVAALSSAAGELLRACNEIWRRRHQVCGMSASGVWGPHSWHPAGSVLQDAYALGAAGTCPLLLCHGGLSCVRPVHSWAERWWATLHLSRDLSNHQSLELSDVLALSSLDEWKLCTTAWFLSQCVGNSGLSIMLGLLRAGSLPSWPMRRFTGDVPQHLAAHLSQCARCMASPTIAAQLATLQELVQLISCPPEKSAAVAGEVLYPSRGVWSAAATSAFGRPTPRQSSAVCLSDVLRGSIAVGECEYLCTAMRDLLLLCLYAVRDGGAVGRPAAGSDWPLQVENSSWTGLARVLDEQLPVFITLHRSMQLALPGPEVASAGAVRARGCELWAAAFRSPTSGVALSLRPPVASFKSFHYGMQLLRCQGWEAMRWWSKHQHMKEFSAYLAGRQWLSAGRFDPARESFVHAESVASKVVECLRTAGLQAEPPDVCPDVACYYAHLAELFSSCRGPASDQYIFSKKAAQVAEEMSCSGGADRSACQRLWSAACEKAIGLELWDEARDVLLRLDAFESCLRLLGQRLREKGKIDLMLKLPQKHRDFFMGTLHEQALLSPPTIGSDSLACYQSLYALHFTSEEYLQAASIAHSMYAALGASLRREELPAEAPAAAQILAGDCIAKLDDVPCKLGTDTSEAIVPMDLEVENEAGNAIWPVLEQQRNALLMLITALSLTPEKLILVPDAAADVDFGTGLRGAAGTSSSAVVTSTGLTTESPEFEDFRQWFAQAESRAERQVFRLEDAERLLAVTEASMILSGRTGDLAPPKVAQCVASLGLLGLALQIAQACKLDLWLFALRPFLKLCLESEQSSDEKVAALVEAAQGPALSFMFAQSDGCEPLGVEGSSRRGLWKMLEESLRALSEPQPGTGFLDASGTKLYSLVAHEILSLKGAEGKLPDFITKALSGGPSWVCLLRLYAKHMRLEEAVDLLREQLKLCSPTLGPLEWSPLKAFPVQVALQLQQCLRQRVEDDRTGAAARAADALDELLKQFREALEDLERK